MSAKLTSQHPDVFLNLNSQQSALDKSGSDMKQTSITSFNSTPYTKDGKLYKEITRNLAKRIISSLRPLSVVDGEHFR